MKKHDMVFSYTNGDDGVWLDCSCGAKILLGFNCSPEYALEVANEHKEIAQGVVKIVKSKPYEPFADGIIPRWCCD